MLVESYRIYSSMEEKPFDSFITWAEPILNDFNEIDRHLVPQKSFFDYLASIKAMDRWGVSDAITPLIENYLDFWNSLHKFYLTLNENLLHQHQGYQGMVYRKAAEDIEYYLQAHQETPHIFIGFNALSPAEEAIIQELLENGAAEIYWDIDAHFADDDSHSASFFFRRHLENWKYYKQKKPPKLPNHFKGSKTFQFIETQTEIEQVKYVGAFLSTQSPEVLNKTALVLANESLLIPLLYSLPSNIGEVNITMGIPLQTLPAVFFFSQLLDLHCQPTKTFYHKKLQPILNHPVGQYLVKDAQEIWSKIVKDNLSYISLEKLLSLGKDRTSLSLLFGPWEASSRICFTAIKRLLDILSEQQEPHVWEHVVFQKIRTVFDAIEAAIESFPKLQNCREIAELFKHFITSEKLNLQGNPFSGLQVMGVLETRVLDFEQVIMISVNEGILPTGKSQSSYLTFDLKAQFGLPLHTEKDAVYAYHFFRLLQRAKTATFLYSNATKGLNTGEKSRFLIQLEVEKLPQHTHSFQHTFQEVHIPVKEIASVPKNEAVMQRIKNIAFKGFSPSALTAYIQNPMQFYLQRILKINESEALEETVAYNTLGTIVHETLELLYSPFKNALLDPARLERSKKEVPSLVSQQFEKHFKLGDYSQGKNLIVFEVAKRYVENLIDLDISYLKKGNKIELLGLELPLRIPIIIPELDFPVFLNGTVDRLDSFNGQPRIIDYKTGRVVQGELEIVDWDSLIEDGKYSKAFQVLTYAYMQQKTAPITNMTAGVLSFKNLNEGFLKFGKKEAPRASTKVHEITSEILMAFETQLKKLILEICNPEIPFVEREIKKAAHF